MIETPDTTDDRTRAIARAREFPTLILLAREADTEAIRDRVDDLYVWLTQVLPVATTTDYRARADTVGRGGRRRR